MVVTQKYSQVDNISVLFAHHLGACILPTTILFSYALLFDLYPASPFVFVLRGNGVPDSMNDYNKN